MAEYYRPARIIRGNGPHPMRWGTWLGDDERPELRTLVIDALLDAGLADYSPDRANEKSLADAILKALGVPETPQAI